jgi:NADPH:quinone reductase-like Zn-dependent oxidoreductase
MKALATIVKQFGPARDVVKLTSIVSRSLAPNEVMVRMLKCAINPSDIIAISGAYRSRITLPFFPGYEGVGVIEEMGGQVTGSKIGDRVLPLGSAGCWQELKVAEAKWCFRMSDVLTLEQAATMYVNPATAWVMLHEQAKVAPGMNVIISAGASEIGRMMIRMLNIQGIEPIVTVRRLKSAGRLESMRIRQILVTSSPTFADHLAACTRHAPADLVLDAVGGEVGRTLARSVRPGGLFIHYGLLCGDPLPPETFHGSDIKFELFTLRNWVHSRSCQEITSLLANLERLVLNGTARSDIENCYPLDKIHAALERHNSPDRAGKILLSM